VLESCDALVARVRGVLASRRVGAASIREFFDRVGDKPGAADSPEAVSWWAARLLLLLVPSNTEGWLRRELMEQTSTAARLRSLQERLTALAASEGVGGAGCVIM
jgi:hypothetical protein